MSWIVRSALLVAVLAAVLQGLQYVDRLTNDPYPIPPSNGGVLITGCSTGIGLHAALTLAERGFTVYAGVRKEADIEKIKNPNLPNLKPVILDVADEASIDHAWESIQESLKAEGVPLIGLVNNAGIAQVVPVEFHAPPMMKQVFQTNLHGPIYLTQKVLPTLRDNHGRIIMMSSITSVIISPLSGAYSASKRAMDAIAETLRLELQPFNVSVSKVMPAFVSSEIFGKTTKFIDEKMKVDEEIMRVYGFHYRPEKRARNRGYVAKASPPTVTSEAVLDALTNPYPKPRYVVANINGHPAWIPLALAEFLPTPVYDLILRHLS